MKRFVVLVLCLCLGLNTLMISTFADNAVSEFEIYVTAPVPGEKAVYESSVPTGADYSAEIIKWIGIFDDNKVFKPDYDYTVQVRVVLNDNCDGYIKKVDGKAKINGLEAKLYSISDDKKQAIVSLLFRGTEEEELPFENAVPASDEDIYEAEEDGAEVIYLPDLFFNFKDVPGDAYFAEAVKWALIKNITAGTSSTTFSPDKICTRAEIITFLWRAVGSPEPSAYNTFSDVTSDDYYYKAALWAFEKGMVTGNEFMGNTPCTRASTVTYLWQNAGSPIVSTTTEFVDVNEDSSYAKAVAWAVRENVTSGTSQTTFSPDVICTRGQIVTFLNRAIN